MSNAQETQKRPYAGQTWAENLFAGSQIAFLAIIERDLYADARDNDIPLTSRIELWVNEEHHIKGFFMGDTTSLPDDGWTLAGTL